MTRHCLRIVYSLATSAFYSLLRNRVPPTWRRGFVLSSLTVTSVSCIQPQPIGFRNLSYAERRSKLNLTTLVLRRLHNDLVMCYKIMFNIIRLEFSNFFTLNTYSSTRGHPYKLYVIHSRINVRKHFFACRVVNVWNSLPLDSDDFRFLHCFYCVSK